MNTFRKIVFVEPPSIEKRVPERFAGCAYELYHFPDLANLYPFSIIAQAGYDIDYIDAYLIAYTQENDEAGVLSYDKSIDRVKGIKRFEP